MYYCTFMLARLDFNYHHYCEALVLSLFSVVSMVLVTLSRRDSIKFHRSLYWSLSRSRYRHLHHPRYSRLWWRCDCTYPIPPIACQGPPILFHGPVRICCNHTAVLLPVGYPSRQFLRRHSIRNRCIPYCVVSSIVLWLFIYLMYVCVVRPTPDTNEIHDAFGWMDSKYERKAKKTKQGTIL